MINKVTLLGHLGADPEIKRLESGSVVCRLRLATNENWQDRNGEWQSNTTWHSVILWGASAERAEKSLKKGSMIYVEGSIDNRKWQDKDGNDRYTTEIKCRSYRSLDKRTDDESRPNFPSANEPKSFATAPDSASKAALDQDDDLPF